MRVRPVFLEAFAGGKKLSQWLVFKTRSLRRRRGGLVFAFCGPQTAALASHRRGELFETYIHFLKQQFAPNDIQVHNYAMVRGIPREALVRAGFERVENHVCYVNRLESDETLLKAFRGNYRRSIRKAIELGYEFTPDVSPAEFLALSRETYAGSELTPPPARVLQRMGRYMVPAGTALFSGVRVDGKLKSASVVLYSGGNAFYVYGASSRQRDPYAGIYLQFENMRSLRERGVKRYDVGGARLEGSNDNKAASIAAFKRRFGGEEFEESCGCYRQHAA